MTIWNQYPNGPINGEIHDAPLSETNGMYNPWCTISKLKGIAVVAFQNSTAITTKCQWWTMVSVSGTSSCNFRWFTIEFLKGELPQWEIAQDISCDEVDGGLYIFENTGIICLGIHNGLQMIM